MRSEIRSLTGLRGLAALWVMTGHYIRDAPADLTVRFVINHMYIAVDLFMVLSGFVLAMSYDADFRVPLNAQRMWRFVLLRIARIYPVYGLSCIACVLLVVTGIGVWGPPDISPMAVALNLAMAGSSTSGGAASSWIVAAPIRKGNSTWPPRPNVKASGAEPMKRSSRFGCRTRFE